MAEKVLEKLTIPQRIMLIFGASSGCLSLEELERKTGVDRKTLTVYLSRFWQKKE
ncbi:plasmid regulator [Sulfolobus sp. S-194]|uniref:plasmid regulator n=1 Tax=Sulfolobus sp. S-194 TaxID=2512240 RepID=UPI00336A2012